MWNPCHRTKHKWSRTRDLQKFVCAECGALGYRRVGSTTILPCACPSCGESTKKLRSRCPDCVKKKKAEDRERQLQKKKQAEKKNATITGAQAEMLKVLRGNDGPAQLPESMSTAGISISSLKKRGLIQSETRTVYWITDKGREFLEAHEKGSGDDSTSKVHRHGPIADRRLVQTRAANLWVRKAGCQLDKEPACVRAT